MQQDIDDAQRFITSFDRPNIRYTVLEKHRPQAQLLRFLEGKQEQPFNQPHILQATFHAAPNQSPVSHLELDNVWHRRKSQAVGISAACRRLLSQSILKA